MLSLIHKEAYQEFLTLLKYWQKICPNSGNDTQPENKTVADYSVEQVSAMKQHFPQLQQCFQQQIMTLTDEELEMTVVSLWRSLQTEIQREFRLLSTDMLFLASSRQASTRENRLNIIGDRITKLIAYCQKILTMAEENN